MKIAAILLSAALAFPAAAEINADFVRIIEARPGSRQVAVVEGRSALHVLDVKGSAAAPVVTVPPGVFDSHFEDAVIHEVDWSADGHFLSISLSDGDESAVLLVLDVACGKKVPVVARAGKRDASGGTWASSGHLLYVTPAGEDIPLAEDGLYSFNPESGKSAGIVRGHQIVGPLEAGGRHLWARVVEIDGDITRYRLISIDLKTGALTRF